MSEPVSTNFIHAIIDKDLEKKNMGIKFTLDSRQNQTVICTSGTPNPSA